MLVSLSWLQWLCLIPITIGTLYMLVCLFTNLSFWRRPAAPPRDGPWPPVTILKPVHGLEKDLRQTLRSTCLQDYPSFQVVLSVQRPDDPALPVLDEIQHEFGPDRVTVAIEQRQAGPNGKINNLIGGLAHARHDVLVISDSDVQLRPDYLKTIVAPLRDPEMGFVCTMYRAVHAWSWFEKLELLTINAELVPGMAFALVTGASKMCLGASTAIRRESLAAIGGLDSLADYLVEDYEMGRRLWTAGKKCVVLPYFVDMVVDLKSPRDWWGHLVYWDQNNRAARPGALFSTIVLRSVPFALIFAALRLGDPVGLTVLGVALAVRLLSMGIISGSCLKDREGLAALYLLPVRDVAALISWVLAFTKRTTIWRGTTFRLTTDGRLVSIAPADRVRDTAYHGA